MIGNNYKHDSSILHSTGEANYLDDMPLHEDTLHAAVVISNYSHAKILKINFKNALKINGVFRVLTSKDIPGVNKIGPIIEDEPALADNLVTYLGQPVAVVIASTHKIAYQAASEVNIEVEELESIFDLEEAHQRKSYVAPEMTIKKGNPFKTFKDSKHTLSGELKIGGQDHFYLEGQIALAIPNDDSSFTIWSSTQHPTEVQHGVANILGISSSSIESKVRRLGGAFGGKESQATIFASIAALCSYHCNKPVKLRLPRNVDMISTGKRHDFLTKYKVGFNNKGKINSLIIDLFSRAGNVADLSGPVMTRAMTHIDNCYSIKNIFVMGYCCKTNTVSNTAFRGFGGPQGIICIETIIDDISKYLGIDNEIVKKVNYYSEKNGVTTPYMQRISDVNRLKEVDNKIDKISNINTLKKDIQSFNLHQESIGGPLRKGLGKILIKFGISFNKSELNQAGSLVHVYTDGSVRLAHGGTEMGQGLFIKVAQVVANVFSIPLETIFLAPTSTAEVPNTSATAASSGSDINGMAAYNASMTIKKRMTKIAAKYFNVKEEKILFIDGLIKSGNKSLSFKELAQISWSKRISLSSTGYYKTPEIHWDQNKMTGNPFFYFSWGSSISEVIVDTLTGESRVLRSEIVQDCGKSLNPAVDIGQIEGAFVQGMGWLTCEELFWNDKGKLLTVGPSTYKIPGSRDTPEIFNVSLLSDAPNNKKTIFRSKAVGEPPLMLSISCWLAIRDAIYNYKKEGRVVLNSPATPEEILKSINL